MRGRSIAGMALAAVVATAATACGGSGGAKRSTSSRAPSGNGVASTSADQIVASAIRAAEAAGSMHVAGSITQAGERVSLDLDLAPAGAAGSIAQGGRRFDLVDSGGQIYIKGNRAFLRDATGSATAGQMLLGKWLKGSAKGELSQIGDLTTIRGLLDAVASGHGKLAKGARSTIDGRPVIAVRDTTKGGTLYVATSGRPYPLRITNGGTTSGAVTFSRFGARLAITAPRGAVDLDGLGGGTT